ncbi:MAG: polysaccharide deacetylase [Roseiarcus sp.]
MPASVRLFMITFAACVGLAGAARASDCAFTPAPATRLQSMAAVTDYRPVLKACVAADGRKAVAIREMTVAGQKIALLADPEALTTRLERAACWTCHDESEDELKATRMGRAIRESAEAPGLIQRGFLENAGLTHGGGQGDFVTGDLCPSRKPLARAFFTRLESAGPHVPVALSISGLWLIHHFDDFRWLVSERNSGALDILWTDHTYHHPYHRRLPDDENFLLSKGVDPQEEILDTERALIANGETPSLFFRFPGLISSDPLMQAVRQDHLITLGADAWLALGQKPERGSIVLVHPNGNEPKGLALFSADLAHGEIAAPLEPLTAAPE